MATTVHIPPEVLESVDQQAKKRQVSRNKYIVEALRSRVEADRRDQPIPQAFLEDMKRWREDRERVALVTQMQRRVVATRRSRKPAPL